MVWSPKSVTGGHYIDWWQIYDTPDTWVLVWMLWLQTELQPGWDGRKLRRKQQAASRPETRQWILTAVETLKFSTWNAARNAALLLPCPSREQRRAQRSQCSQNSIISLSKCILGPPPATAGAVHGATLVSEKSNFAVKYHQQQSRAELPLQQQQLQQPHQ